MHRIPRAVALLTGAVVVAAAAACKDNVLDVNNPNNPDRAGVLNLTRDIEALSSRLYQNVHTAHFGANDNLENQMNVASFENASTLSNFGMSPRGGINRTFVDNVPGGASLVGNRRDFQQLTNAAGTASTILEKIYVPGFSLGTGAGNDARIRAFTWFGYGTALGDLALAYDSAGVPRSGALALTDLPLVSYDSVMRVALRALDSAQTYAATSSPITGSWLDQSSDVSATTFTRIIRSYKARYRANVARTPAARNDSVNWAQVAADAQAGITTDFTLQLSPSAGWDYTWIAQHFVGSAWNNATYYIIGMADSSGAYDGWLATPRDSRSTILIRTIDARFPAGNDRPTQIANSPSLPVNTKLYFRNRQPSEDASGNGWQYSQYEHNRWRALYNATRLGPWITFSKVENDMLAAEALLRTGNIAGATALIDVSRVRNNLPALTGRVTALGQAIPGGRSCVPRVPDAAQGYLATKCGDVFEAMKWEKRLESEYAGWAVWFFDSRGWGDMPVGTPFNWPVPFQELDARIKPYYTLGGLSGTSPRPGGLPASTTYGFGTQN